MYSDYFKFTQWQHDGLKVQGVSVAGIGTSFYLPDFKLSIDVAQGLPFAMRAKTFLITHGHMDHASGIPYIISQKALNSVAPPQFFMPEAMIGPLTQIMKTWEKIENHSYQMTSRKFKYHL